MIYYWKEVAKKHIGKNELLKAVTVMKKHGIVTTAFVEKIKKYKKAEDKVLREKRTYTPTEHAAQTELRSNLVWDMLQAIDGTKKPMPEHLK